MTSSLRQIVAVDSAPSNQLSIGGNKFFWTSSTATQAGNSLVALATISHFVGNTIAGISDPVNGAWPAALNILTTAGNADTRSFLLQNAASIPAGDHGIAIGGSTTTVADSSKSWTTNQWVGATVTIADTGQTSTVTSNTSNTLTFGAIGSAVSGGNTYAVGGYIAINVSGNDDYAAALVIEATGVATASLAGHNATTATVGSGTNNVTSGAAALGSSPIGLLGFSFNDTGATGPNAPAAGSGETDKGAFWTWDIGQTNARLQFENVSNPGTLASLFSSHGSNEYCTFMVALLDSGGGGGGSPTLTQIGRKFPRGMNRGYRH